MRSSMTAFFSGVLFAIGLGISGMTDANKVIGFLDLFGKWDPALAFVMIGAIGVHLPLSRWILKRPSPRLAPTFVLPSSTQLNASLFAGAFLFGIGWGMSGYCPGPGLISMCTGNSFPLLFGFSMLAGMGLHTLVGKKESDPGSDSTCG